MAAVSLFRDTNMAAVTSRENAPFILSGLFILSEIVARWLLASKLNNFSPYHDLRVIFGVNFICDVRNEQELFSQSRELPVGLKLADITRKKLANETNTKSISWEAGIAWVKSVVGSFLCSDFPLLKFQFDRMQPATAPPLKCYYDKKKNVFLFFFRF